MSTLEIGVDTDDYRLAIKDALRRVAEHGFRVVELPATREIAPANLSASGRRHLSHCVRGLGLDAASLTADLPGLRFGDPQTAGERIWQTQGILDLAADLKVPIVTASVGALTHPDTGEPSPMAIEALKEIGAHADTRGITYAIRPGRESGEQLSRVLDELRCPSIGVCLDPAAMVMSGVNPLASIEGWVEHLRLFHVRDATAGLGEHVGAETRLGEGEVDLVGVLAGLDAADYSGPYILRRTASATPADDLRSGRDVLMRALPPG